MPSASASLLLGPIPAQSSAMALMRPDLVELVKSRRLLLSPLRSGSLLEPAMHNREERRNKKQCGYRGKQETADHGTSQRRILLAAFAQPPPHRHHAQD